MVQRISSTAHQGHGGGKDKDCQSGKRGRYMRSTRLKQAGIKFKIKTNFEGSLFPLRKPPSLKLVAEHWRLEQQHHSGVVRRCATALHRPRKYLDDSEHIVP